MENNYPKLLNLNLDIPNLRFANEIEIRIYFSQSYVSDNKNTIKWLFYLRDPRNGLGERRIFYICFRWLYKYQRVVANNLLKYIPIYGRWDDFYEICDNPYEIPKEAIKIISKQLEDDVQNMIENKPISLCAKWLKSCNASSDLTKKRGKKTAQLLGLSQREYRHLLKTLRSYSNVVECNMSRNLWNKIDYNKVPYGSKMLHNKAFLNHNKQDLH